ncbi:MAG: DUF3267 domain-containing protein, partial [Staphylothermus sp.]|nr:DUF3267 domain-containing protein [Staphylothermus sp.]
YYMGGNGIMFFDITTKTLFFFVVGLYIAFLHELFHYFFAIGLGYKAKLDLRKVVYFKTDIENRILNNKLHVIIVFLAPQIITVYFLINYIYENNPFSLLFGLGNIMGSLYDYYFVLKFLFRFRK